MNGRMFHTIRLIDKQINWRITAIVVSFLCSLAWSIATIPAATAAGPGSSLTTSPVSTDLSGAPGSTITTTLHLMNDTVAALPIQITLREFKAHGDLGQATIYEPSKDDPAISWVHFSTTSFIAQPQVWQPITMTISLPKSAALGYYYAVLFHPVLALPSAGQNANALKSANAVFVLVNALSPGAKQQLSVNSFSSLKGSYQFLPATFNVLVHNTGNIHLAPGGNVFISRTPNGQPIDTLSVNSAQGNVLPGTDRLFQVAWENGFPIYQYKQLDGQVVADKKGQPLQQLHWDFTHISSFRFGKYYAKLVLVYNNGVRDVPITGQLSFWVIPWFLVLGIALFLLLIGLGVWTIIRIIVKTIQRPSKRSRR
ncbi:MAG TPA: hypothetical protein VGS08_02810 [Candidatus Saccharimonadales bacterium]|nr:hypothetical protein [Candidatus Saccharimonadales bacterium]